MPDWLLYFSAVMAALLSVSSFRAGKLPRAAIAMGLAALALSFTPLPDLWLGA